MISAANIHAHELIDLPARIIESADPTLVGVSGIIVAETKNTITIRSGSRVKQFAKSIAKKIEIATLAGACFISGLSLIARPEDRVSRL